MLLMLAKMTKLKQKKKKSNSDRKVRRDKKDKRSKAKKRTKDRHTGDERDNSAAYSESDYSSIDDHAKAVRTEALRQALQSDHGTVEEKRARISQAFKDLKEVAVSDVAEEKKKSKKRKRGRLDTAFGKSNEHPAGDSELIAAAANGDLSQVKALLESNPKTPINGLLDGFTALHKATLYGHADVVKFLLELGADANVRTEKGSSALHFACTSGSAPIAGLLVDSGALPYSRDQYGSSPYDLGLQNLLDEYKRLKDIESTQKQRELAACRDLFVVQQNAVDSKTQEKSKEGSKEESNDQSLKEALRGNHSSWLENMLHNSYEKRLKDARKEINAKKREYESATAESEEVEVAETSSSHLHQYEEYLKQWKALQSLLEKLKQRKGQEEEGEHVLQGSSFICISDIPWPRGLKGNILSIPSALGSQEKRQILLSEKRRWHPDKFLQSFGKFLKEEEKEEIVNRVKSVSQSLNDDYKT